MAVIRTGIRVRPHYASKLVSLMPTNHGRRIGAGYDLGMPTGSTVVATRIDAVESVNGVVHVDAEGVPFALFDAELAADGLYDLEVSDA